MKYEAVSGNQDLFDGAYKDAVIAIKRPFISGVRSEEMHFFSSTFDAVMKAGSSFNFNNVILKTAEYAERRIIRTPTWTVEDQKAGRDPKVGAELLHESEGYVNFVGEFDFRWMLRTKEGGLYLAEKFYCSPIETPEEKAERLRNEWINEAINAVRKTDVNGYESIYDALLSGTLSVPTKGSE